MAQRFFTVQKGYQIDLDGPVYLYASDIPYTATEYVAGQVDALVRGSIWISQTDGTIYLKKYNSFNSISDWVIISGSNASSVGLLKNIQYMVDQIDGTPGYTTWAAGSPPVGTSLFDGNTCTIYKGNGTVTPDAYKVRADLIDNRIGIKNNNTIYIGTAAGDTILDPNPDNGTWEQFDYAFIEDDLDGKGAMYYWSAGGAVKYADPDWYAGDGLIVSSTAYPVVSTQDSTISNTMTIEGALVVLDERFEKYFKKSLATLSSTALVALDTLNLATLTSRYLITWKVIIYSGTTVFSGIIECVAYNNAGTINYNYSVRSILDASLNITPVFSVSTATTNLTLNVQASDWTAGTYNISIIRELLNV